MENWERHQQRAAEEVKYMSEHEDYFKCRDCKDEYRCPINNTDSRACGAFASKKKVRLPIVEQLFSKIALSKSGEPITFSEKEIVVLTEVLYKDMTGV